jgi:cyclopropane fatty-acyl-phospholipid synthase-like methyltransferase
VGLISYLHITGIQQYHRVNKIAMTPKLAAIFVSSWNIYQKIITYNYMRHKEMAEKTRAAFNSAYIKTPMRVLDFGCGDAQPIIPQLQLQPVSEYIGYDLSGSALEFAKQNLAAIPCKCLLRCAPMQSFSDIEMENFDIIHSSYAIHHLQDDEKINLLQACFNRLNNGGIMIVIDIFSNAGQKREAYIEEYIHNIETAWAMVTRDEKQQVYDHIRNYDLPVYTGDMAGWARAAGFTVTEYRIDERHTMLALKKNSL